ncbi:MAG: hypothetical protein QXZ09_05710 [Candidatus Methanomethylicaceae archaeon]
MGEAARRRRREEEDFLFSGVGSGAKPGGVIDFMITSPLDGSYHPFGEISPGSCSLLVDGRDVTLQYWYDWTTAGGSGTVAFYFDDVNHPRRELISIEYLGGGDVVIKAMAYQDQARVYLIAEDFVTVTTY